MHNGSAGTKLVQYNYSTRVMAPHEVVNGLASAIEATQTLYGGRDEVGRIDGEVIAETMAASGASITRLSLAKLTNKGSDDQPLVSVLDLCLEAGLVNSKAEIRRLIEA